MYNRSKPFLRISLSVMLSVFFILASADSANEPLETMATTIVVSPMPAFASAKRKTPSLVSYSKKFVTRASYYGHEFAGRRSASGRIFNPRRLTAAHPRLPFGTRILVKNPRNGKSCTVVVEDRGPHKGGRGIDLSLAAAKRIGLSGVATVHCFVNPQWQNAARSPAAPTASNNNTPATPNPTIFDQAAQAANESPTQRRNTAESSIRNRTNLENGKIKSKRIRRKKGKPVAIWFGAQRQDVIAVL